MKLQVVFDGGKFSDHKKSAYSYFWVEGRDCNLRGQDISFGFLSTVFSLQE
jgi:hypothetical protein